MSADTVIDCNTYLGANLYLYCYGDPVNYVDHSGNIAMQRKLNDEGLYPTSVALQYQHWQKYNRRYFESYLTGSMDCMWVETASSLSLTPMQGQNKSSFEDFREELVKITNSKNYHTTAEYVGQAILLSKRIVGTGISLVTFIINPVAGTGAWLAIEVAVDISIFVIEQTFSIKIAGVGLYECYLDDQILKNLHDIISVLGEISERFESTNRMYGSYVNIYLNYQDYWSQIKFEVTDWVGAIPSGKHARQIYTRELNRENFFLISGLLRTRTYVYYCDVGRGYSYY